MKGNQKSGIKFEDERYRSSRSKVMAQRVIFSRVGESFFCKYLGNYGIYVSHIKEKNVDNDCSFQTKNYF
jgi:hypothetical protein